MECNLRLLVASGNHIDILKECQVSRLLSNMCKLLDEFGKSHNLPRSSVHVEEDFWYMRGAKGCMVDKIQDNVWPCTLIFHIHSSSALQLNSMLSQTVCSVNAQDELGIEGLKQVLFRDPCKSRSEFFELRHHGTEIHKVVIGKYLCCECCYIQCTV